MTSISWKQMNNPLKKVRREVMWLTRGLCLQWVHNMSLLVQGNELQNAQEALPTFTHGGPRPSTSNGVRSRDAIQPEEHTASILMGKKEKRKENLALSHHGKNRGLLSTVNIYRKTLCLQIHDKYHGMEDHLYVYQPRFLTTDSHTT